MLRKQIEDELLGLSTHQGSSRNMQERTNLSSLPMEVCLCVLRLQTWLFWRYTDSSKNVSGAIGSHLQFKRGICQAGILLASYVSYLTQLSVLTASLVYNHHFCSTSPSSTSSPCTGGSSEGSSSSHSS